ncbi:inositol-pentakisphosphate 2-kinase [Mycena belliarum]|uniref:Inositol-pentakisphosphate 2-kinase n=1 Tax=Mycena belliarum TaxID=1033014 RepID=A0AAD6U4M3_9AGAR|nr:inositol-pentakisphosphate 2-kinase [Mycena belliae]
MHHLTDTVPADWEYLSEGGATIVFRYKGPPNPAFEGTVLRLRKCPLYDDTGRRIPKPLEFESCEALADRFGLPLDAPPPAPERPDPTVSFQQEIIAQLIPPAHLPRLEPLETLGGKTKRGPWLETLAEQCDPQRPLERRQTHGIEQVYPTPVLATDLVGGQGIAVEIKPKWGFIPSPTHLSDHTRAVKMRTCRFCMHSHLRTQQGETVAVGYCPLDLYSADESRVKKALAGLWDAWVASDGSVNSFKVFVHGKKISPTEASSVLGIANDLTDPKESLLSALLPVIMRTPVFRTLARLQRTLDPLDIEGVAALLAQAPGPEPFGRLTLRDYRAFLPAYLGATPPADPVRFHVVAYLLSATFKDCSVILRVPDGTATVIDLDEKDPRRMRKWQELDWQIACAYAEVPEAERKLCVDGKGEQ